MARCLTNNLITLDSLFKFKDTDPVSFWVKEIKQLYSLFKFKDADPVSFWVKEIKQLFLVWLLLGITFSGNQYTTVLDSNTQLTLQFLP